MTLIQTPFNCNNAILRTILSYYTENIMEFIQLTRVNRTIYYAIFETSDEIWKYLAKKNKSLLYVVGCNNGIPRHFPPSETRYTVANMLIQHNKDDIKNGYEFFGWSPCPIFHSLSNNDIKLAELLLNNGVRACSIEKFAAAGQIEHIKLLLRYGANPTYGLKHAAINGHIEVVNLLIICGAAVNNELYHYSYITEVIYNGHFEIVKLLFEFIDITLYGINCINAATTTSHHEIAKYILIKMIKSNFDNPLPLINIAAEYGYIDIVKIYLEAGADPADGICNASRCGHLEIVKLLLNNCESFYKNTRTNVSGNVLSNSVKFASQNGYFEIVKLLVEKGAEPMHGICAAARNGHTDIVRYLFTVNAQLNKNRFDVMSSCTLPQYLNGGISEAATHGHIEIVKMFVDNGADPNEGISDAAAYGHLHVVQFLLEKRS